MMAYGERLVAFDSNVLTFFLDANRGAYRDGSSALTDQRIAAYRLFLYCKPLIVPSVAREAEVIRQAGRREEHLRLIAAQFGEFLPDELQKRSIERRAAELLPHHLKGADDCRILAEVEEDGDVPVLVTFDRRFKTDLASHTKVLIETPVECWLRLNIARGTPPQWVPARGHPLADATWWRWE
jgi:hypothetical protein